MKLSCEHITKTYGNREVLHDITLTLEQGKIYGLIGRNGAGKTTLLSILTAQNPATSGLVTLDGEPVWENQKALSRFCFSRELNISAESGLAALKAKDYLRMASMFYPDWNSELEKRLLVLFHLDPKKRFRKMSKGMLSMVTIIVALCSRAPFTFLDEPVAGLDVVAREQFYQLLLQEYTESGRTFVVSTHIIEEAADILEEVILLHDGRILVQANTQEFLEHIVHVSGKAEDVDGATRGLEVCRAKVMGRSKGVTVLLKPGQQVAEGYDVSVQSVGLQKAFVALCGEEGCI